MEKMTIGAIRWDAWFKSENENDPSFQVQRSLSPKRFHFRAPFFAEVKNEKIFIPRYDQEIFDKEMEYAIDAGIDYFAYVWYGNPGQDGLSLARKLHTTSKYRNKVKMCACFDSNGINKDYVKNELPKLFKEEFYKKVFDGRPLVYYFGLCNNFDGIKKDIEFFTDICEKENIKKPFFAIMDATVEQCLYVKGDAISHYCAWGGNGEPFEAMHLRNLERWENEYKQCEENGLQYIPTITSGWNNETRHENPVGWIKGDLSKSYVQYATADDVYNEVISAKEFLKNKNIPINSAIIYAWNEHDEGGWICPTISVDENGNQLYENGSPIINDERINAVKKAINN